MTLIYGIIAVFLTWIWLYYFELQGISKKENRSYIILTYAIGFFSYSIYTKINYSFSEQLTYKYHSETLNHFMTSVFKHGLVGELSKLIPVFIFYYSQKKRLNQPVDVFFIFTAAFLGFSASENISYSNQDPFSFFYYKTILGTYGEVFCSIPVVYALIKSEYVLKGGGIFNIISMFFVAVLLHGAYDFWIYYGHEITYGFIVTILFFVFLVSIYATTLTNALNFDVDYSYKSQKNTAKIIPKIFKFYLIVTGVQFFIMSWGKGIYIAFENVKETVMYAGIVLYITVYRLNKIKLIKKKWNILKIELPFTLYRIDTFNGRTPRYKFKFKGETFNEYFINQYLNEQCNIFPLSKRNSFIMSQKRIFIEKKIFLKNDESFYLIKVCNENEEEYMLLKSKTSGKILVKRKYAIAALFSIMDIEDVNDKNLTALDFQFREWVFIKHR